HPSLDATLAQRHRRRGERENSWFVFEKNSPFLSFSCNVFGAISQPAQCKAFEMHQPTGVPPRPTDTMRELRYVLRALRQSPGFAIVAVTSLALGIGANTAIYGVARALLSDPLPVAEPDRLLAIAHQFTPPKGVRGIWQINGTSHRDPATGRSYRAPISYPVYRALRDAAAGSADVFAFTFLRELNVSAGNQAVSC